MSLPRRCWRRRAALPATSEFERLAMAIDRRRKAAHTAVRIAISSARYGASVRALASLGSRRGSAQ
jgi:hypothetical protein